MATLEDVWSQLLGLQPAIDEQIQRFRARPRLPRARGDQLDVLLDGLRRLSVEALTASGPSDERHALSRLAADGAIVLWRLAEEADLAWREGHDAPWPAAELHNLTTTRAALEARFGGAQSAVSGMASLPAAERERMIRRVTRDLVRTMRAVPAPGIDPLTTQDWVLLGIAALLFCVLFAVVVIMSGGV